MASPQYPLIAIQIVSVKTSELKELEIGRKGLSKKQYDTQPTTTVRQHASGSTIEIQVDLIVTMEQTGKRCYIQTLTSFDVKTNYSFIDHPASDITLQIFTELTLAAFSHTRMALKIKSIGTLYENALLPFGSFSETMKIAEQSIKAMIN